MVSHVLSYFRSSVIIYYNHFKMSFIDHKEIFTNLLFTYTTFGRPTFIVTPTSSRHLPTLFCDFWMYGRPMTTISSLMVIQA